MNTEKRIVFSLKSLKKEVEGKNMEKQYYSVKDVSNLLGVGARTVQRYIHAGKIKAVKIGKEYRINEQSLKEFMNVDTETSLESEIARLAKQASNIMANPNSTEADNERLKKLLDTLNQKKQELKETKG